MNFENILKIDNSNRYSDSIIYAIVCKNKKVKDCYVGSTTNYEKRKIMHRTACNNANATNYPCKVYKFIRSNGGFKNFKFKILEQPDVTTNRQLHARERHYVDKLKPTLNKQVPNRTNKQFYIDNKKVYNERSKQRYIDNRDRLLEKMKQRVVCCCGRSYPRSHKTDHNKTKYHINYIESTSSDSN